jgi:hypothetical protein
LLDLYHFSSRLVNSTFSQIAFYFIANGT